MISSMIDRVYSLKRLFSDEKSDAMFVKGSGFAPLVFAKYTTILPKQFLESYTPCGKYNSTMDNTT